MERTKINNLNLENLVLDAFKSTGFIVVNKTLIKKLGIIGAVILSNYLDKYIYFKTQDQLEDNMFFLTYKQQIHQLNIPEHTLIIWRKRLQDIGILKIKRKGLPAKDWYSIDFHTLSNYIYNIHGESQRQVPEQNRGLVSEQNRGLYKETKFKDTIIKKEKNIKKRQKVDPWAAVYDEWYQYKKEKGQTYKPIGKNTFESHLRILSNEDVKLARQIIQQSIANNYAGIFALKKAYKTPAKFGYHEIDTDLGF